ncbi:MAG: glycosyl hydrolase family 28-related protein [Nanoarchaeota archaeon]
MRKSVKSSRRSSVKVRKNRQILIAVLLLISLAAAAIFIFNVRNISVGQAVQAAAGRTSVSSTAETVTTVKQPVPYHTQSLDTVIPPPGCSLGQYVKMEGSKFVCAPLPAAGSGSAEAIFINVKDFGAVPDDNLDDWPALQAALNQLSGNTGKGNHVIFIPAGTYYISNTLLPPNSASYFTLMGEGKLATQIRWVGSAGVPMIKMLNARGVVLRDFTLFGTSPLPGYNAGVPSHGILFQKGSGQQGAGAPAFNYLERVGITNAYGEVIDNGIAFTAEGYSSSDQYDGNNEQTTFNDVNIENVNKYGISFEHSNSLAHKIFGGVINAGEAAINNVGPNGKPGGSFQLFGTVLSTNKANSNVFRLGNTHHAISIVGAVVEQPALNNGLLTTPYTIDWGTSYSILGGSFKVHGADYDILFDGSNGAQLSIIGADIKQELRMRFPTAGSSVVFRDSTLNLGSLEYNNDVLIDNSFNSAGPGSMHFTNLGSGKLVIENPRGNFAEPIMYRFPLNSATTSVQGYDYFEICNTQPTTITNLLDGYLGKEVTLFSCNANTILQNNVNIRTPNLQDLTLPAVSFTKLRKMNAAFGNFWLVESVN